ncbi:tryptophan synthase subunit beta [Thalassomonas viridans]|uniref:Tryptophan synthase beta chain n=1 Tax=Thalassomonas viridans TaxID=137584 RepID=A0AAF0CD97_9GAMM|nr:tryptophan synthase subunit beta [Thalassomonas viridans]WDE08983.1 tryptophan synthase subunit beta [Thalassomonas viridans]
MNNIKEAYFGAFGGSFVPESLVPALQEYAQAYTEHKDQPWFKDELSRLLKEFVGRQTPLTPANKLSKLIGARVYLKREDLAHTGAHKINNVIGQALLAKHMGKRRIIAETGAGQHGVATATVCALLDLECVIYMGTNDMARQELNVFRMELLGAKVVGVDLGTATLKDAINEALRDFVTNVGHSHYLLGSALGPHPYPTIVRDFQSVIGKETREQILEKEGRLPTHLVACVGGGSNSIGLFHPFIEEKDVAFIGVEAAGCGLGENEHSIRLAREGFSSLGVMHGCKSFVLQNEHGQIGHTHSIAPGLDYAMIGPEHARLFESGRASYISADDNEALSAFGLLSRSEGIIPALESAHAVAGALKLKGKVKADDIVVINISGRGDKDMASVMETLKKSAKEQLA